MCGWHGDSERQCGGTPSAITRYQKRVSGPLLSLTGSFENHKKLRAACLIGTKGVLEPAIFAKTRTFVDANSRSVVGYNTEDNLMDGQILQDASQQRGN